MNQVLIEQQLQADVLLHMCLHTAKSACVGNLPSQSIAVADTPWPHFPVCPQPLLCSNYGNRKYAGRQTHTPGLPAPTLYLSLPTSRPLLSSSLPCLSYSWSVVSPSSLVCRLSDSLTLLLPLLFFSLPASKPKPPSFSFRPSPHRQVVVFYVLFGTQ